MTVSLDKPVPDFSAPATGGTFSLAGQRGKTLVLYFYPKDNTPGCTTEAMNFRDQHDFVAAGAVVFGISATASSPTRISRPSWNCPSN